MPTVDLTFTGWLDTGANTTTPSTIIGGDTWPDPDPATYAEFTTNTFGPDPNNAIGGVYAAVTPIPGVTQVTAAEFSGDVVLSKSGSYEPSENWFFNHRLTDPTFTIEYGGFNVFRSVILSGGGAQSFTETNYSDLNALTQWARGGGYLILNRSLQFNELDNYPAAYVTRVTRLRLTITYTVGSMVRQWPNDSGGLTATPRTYPPPRTGRTFGGQP